MRKFPLAFTALILIKLILSTQTIHAQERIGQFHVEMEPVSYLLNGASITGAYQTGQWTYSVEVFSRENPGFMHGNNNFDTSVQGIELQFESFISSTSGFFVGPKVGIFNREITHTPTGDTNERINLSVGMRGGYQWYPGLGGMYLTPVAGLGYSLNEKDLKINDATFNSSYLTPWGTIGIGWTF